MLDKTTCLRINYINKLNFTVFYCFFGSIKNFCIIEIMGKEKKRSREREEESNCEKRLRRLEKMMQCMSDTFMKSLEKGKFNSIVIKLPTT